ncbi:MULTISPECIES: DUF7848 domain-containing protein [Streptomyces]|uniref:DUF7848 domain-containing protein n=1 Tax=Streptomyces violascens TaxID=67381 RepID=A0ABQ3QRB5_9ACTN|nr:MULTISPECIES: hypothetical protein [Streptomyces]EST17968.1 hypothetical protein M877_39870 [Streptomyces niveus NCIMB 11891]GHI39823.1 hypothetical protein Sviol_42310 [Streptomyces violascens]
MTRATYRFREHKITPDPLGVPEHQAVCVSGDETECGADSGLLPDGKELARWMAEHTRDTGHLRFRAAQWGYALMEPGAWK